MFDGSAGHLKEHTHDKHTVAKVKRNILKRIKFEG